MRANSLEFLLSYGQLAKDSLVLSYVENTLDKMASGGIFDQIEGPRNMPEKHLIQTPHKFGFELLAKHYQINYALVQSAEALTIQFEKFLNTDGPCVLEIQTNNSDNYHQLQQYKQSNL